MVYHMILEDLNRFCFKVTEMTGKRFHFMLPFYVCIQVCLKSVPFHTMWTFKIFLRDVVSIFMFFQTTPWFDRNTTLVTLEPDTFMLSFNMVLQVLLALICFVTLGTFEPKPFMFSSFV